MCPACPVLPPDPADSRSPSPAGPGDAAAGGPPLTTGRLRYHRCQRSSQLLLQGQGWTCCQSNFWGGRQKFSALFFLKFRLKHILHVHRRKRTLWESWVTVRVPAHLSLLKRSLMFLFDPAPLWQQPWSPAFYAWTTTANEMEYIAAINTAATVVTNVVFLRHTSSAVSKARDTLNFFSCLSYLAKCCFTGLLTRKSSCTIK